MVKHTKNRKFHLEVGEKFLGQRRGKHMDTIQNLLILTAFP